MPRSLQQITADAIWALHCQGFGTGEIREALAADTAGVGRPIPLTRRTIQRRKAKLIAEGRPRPKPIEPGEESDAARALLRTYLGLVSIDVDRLEKKQALGEDVAGELRKMLPTVRAVGEIVRVTGPAGENPDRGTRAGRAKHRSAAPASALERIGRELESQPGETPPELPDTNGDGNETGPHDGGPVS